MNKKMLSPQEDRFLKRRNTVSIVFVLAYIVFSVVKRIGEKQALYWLPTLVVCINLLLIAENGTRFFKEKEVRTRSNSLWLMIQLLLNIVFLILLATYLNY